MVLRPAIGGGVGVHGAFFRCIRQNLDGAVCLAVSGELDLSNIAEFRADLSAAMRGADRVILDLHELRYLDSSGINVLLDIHRNFCRQSRRMAVAGPSAMVQRIISIVGLDQVMPVFQTVEEALSYVGSAGPDTSP
jgi:stage II sporulation protein AA (anti-sigma F factor antagonist)